MGMLTGHSPTLIEQAAKIVAQGGHEHTLRVALALCERAKKTGQASSLVDAYLRSSGDQRARLVREIQLAEDAHLPSIQDQLAQVAARPIGYLGPFTFLCSEAARFLGLDHARGIELMREIEVGLGGIQATAAETAARAGAAPPKPAKPEKQS